MRYRSVYEIECECGNKVESESAEMRCPNCGRVLVARWGEVTINLTRISPGSE